MMQVIENIDLKFVGTAGGEDIYSYVGATSEKLLGLVTRPAGETNNNRIINFSNLDVIANMIKFMTPQNAKI